MHSLIVSARCPSVPCPLCHLPRERLPTVALRRTPLHHELLLKTPPSNATTVSLTLSEARFDLRRVLAVMRVAIFPCLSPVLYSAFFTRDLRPLFSREHARLCSFPDGHLPRSEARSRGRLVEGVFVSKSHKAATSAHEIFCVRRLKLGTLPPQSMLCLLANRA